MESHARRNPLLVALWVNAALLLAIVLVLALRSGQPDFLPAAFGQNQQPTIGGGGGVFVMPAQFTANQYGCYLLDVDQQSLCVYFYDPGPKQLRFIAARNYRWDRRLPDYNTLPAPREIQDLVEKNNNAARGAVPQPAPAPDEIPRTP